MKTIYCTVNKTSVMMGFYKRRSYYFGVSYWFFQCHPTVTTKLFQSWLLCLDAKGYFLFFWRPHYLHIADKYNLDYFLDCLLSHHTLLLTGVSKVYSVFSWTEKTYNFHEVCGLVNELAWWTTKPLLWEAFQETLCILYHADLFIWASERQCGHQGSCSAAEKVLVLYGTFEQFKSVPCWCRSLDAKLL